MKVKANVSFTGSINMIAGEERECSESTVLTDLLNAGYVSVVDSGTPENKGTPESQGAPENQETSENQGAPEESKKGKKTTGKAAKKDENTGTD